MQAGKHIGKIVVEASPEAEVSVLRNLPPLDLTDANSTYMIVGGMTGLGHAIACYMIDKGASHLLIVSRNAVTHEKAVSLRQKAREHGCNLQVRDCDISDEKDLLHLLDSLQTGMPAIRGVIQGGMVLDVGVFCCTTWVITLTPAVGYGPRTHEIRAVADSNPSPSCRHSEYTQSPPQPPLLRHAVFDSRCYRHR